MPTGFNMDFMSLLANAFAGQFSPRQEDGLQRLAIQRSQVQPQMGIRGPSTVNWQDLVWQWSGQGGGVMDSRWRGFIRQPGPMPQSQTNPWAQGLGMNNSQYLRFMSGLM